MNLYDNMSTICLIKGKNYAEATEADFEAMFGVNDLVDTEDIDFERVIWDKKAQPWVNHGLCKNGPARLTLSRYKYILSYGR